MRALRFWSFVLWIVVALLCSHAAMAQLNDDDDDETVGAREPVQIYLEASMTDQVNIDITEDRLRRILAMLDRYHQAHPERGITATILFSGAVSQVLSERNPQTHMVDMVKDYVRRGVIEVGYDGDDEPTYKTRPLIEVKQDTAEGHYLAREAAAEALLTEGRDPITGALHPGETGGLKKMQEVFGEAACITGVRLGIGTLANIMPDFGSDSETVHEIRRYNTQAIMFGLPEENVLHSVMYRKWSEQFSYDWSANPLAPPELFWQDDVLRTSEAVGVDNELFEASYGASAFAYVVKRLDRNKVRVIHIELGTEGNYLTKAFREDFVYPPTRYAYAHPDHPQLPAAALLNKEAVDAAFAKEDELFDWLTGDFLPEHKGSHFVSNASLKKMTPAASGYDVPMSALRPAVEQMLKTWGDQARPPKYLAVEDFQFLSLAEMFQVMADALAEESRTGKLPPTVRVAEVHGPLEVVADPTPILGETTVASVLHASAGLDAKLHDDAWTPVPNNVIPTRVKVDGLDLNPAQFLHLMAEALVAPSPDTKLKVKAANMFSSQDILGMRTRPARDMGVAWTYKPAPLALNSNLSAAQ
jgi:hypothetical protein